MPFEKHRFDVVMARHEVYDSAEVARVLRPGGVFVTQQVEAENLRELRVSFGFATPYPEQTLKAHVKSASAAGLVVERSELWEDRTAFPDVASLGRYFAMVPWEAPRDFSPERYANILLGLGAKSAPLTFAVRRFVLTARRPVHDASHQKRVAAD